MFAHRHTHFPGGLVMETWHIAVCVLGLLSVCAIYFLWARKLGNK
jgi:hypothetical protein